VQNGRRNRQVRFALKRAAPSGHLVEHRAEREDVAAGVCFFSFELFRRHVLNGADDGTDASDGGTRALVGGERLAGEKRSACWRDRIQSARLGQTKVHQLRAGFGQHDVRRFEVAVDKAQAVSVCQRIGDFYPDLQHLVTRQRSFLQAGRQGRSLQALHHQVINAVMATHIMKHANVGMT